MNPSTTVTMKEANSVTLPDIDPVEAVNSLGHPNGHKALTKTLSGSSMLVRPRVDSKRMAVILTRLPSSSFKEEPEPERTDKLAPLTRSELFQIFSLASGNFCLGTIYALLAPFFPNESVKKGVGPTYFGLVFGIFEFGQFIFAPLMGILIPHLTYKFVIWMGLFITGWCTFLFGILQWSPHGWTFFWSAFILRLTSSIGGCGFLTANFTVIVMKFHSRTASLFALTEMCFGFGMIVGPSMGGILFEVGGFSMPFFIAGGFCFLSSLFSYLSLPDEKRQNRSGNGKRVGIFQLLMNLGVFINMLITFVAFINIGFIDATLEPHIRSFSNMTPSQVGFMFLISGGVYALVTQIWGIAIQKYGHVHKFVVAGFVLSALTFAILCPMWPIPIEPSITLTVIGQVAYGLSMSPQLVGSFTSGQEETIRAGFPDNIETSAAMSSLYQSSCALGAAIGPAIGGYLFEHWGYKLASFSIFMLQIFMIVIICLYGIYDRLKRASTD